MMTGDDIRNQRMHAQDVFDHNPAVETSQLLVLWVIAEQLYEIRENLGIMIDRKGEK